MVEPHCSNFKVITAIFFGCSKILHVYGIIFQGRCGICGGEFPSRSKLFEHIKSSGHAMLKDAPSQQTQQNTQGKKNKKKKGK